MRPFFELYATLLQRYEQGGKVAAWFATWKPPDAPSGDDGAGPDNKSLGDGGSKQMEVFSEQQITMPAGRSQGSISVPISKISSDAAGSSREPIAEREKLQLSADSVAVVELKQPEGELTGKSYMRSTAVPALSVDAQEAVSAAPTTQVAFSEMLTVTEQGEQGAASSQDKEARRSLQGRTAPEEKSAMPAFLQGFVNIFKTADAPSPSPPPSPSSVTVPSVLTSSSGGDTSALTRGRLVRVRGEEKVRKVTGVSKKWVWVVADGRITRVKPSNLTPLSEEEYVPLEQSPTMEPAKANAGTLKPTINALKPNVKGRAAALLLKRLHPFLKFIQKLNQV